MDHPPHTIKMRPRREVVATGDARSMTRRAVGTGHAVTARYAVWGSNPADGVHRVADDFGRLVRTRLTSGSGTQVEPFIPVCGPQGISVVEKPFTTADLLSKVRESRRRHEQGVPLISISVLRGTPFFSSTSA